MFGRKRRSREPETVDIEARLSILDLRASARQGTSAPADEAVGSPPSEPEPADTHPHEPTTPDVPVLEPTPLEPSFAEIVLPQVVDLTEPAVEPAYGSGEGDRRW